MKRTANGAWLLAAALLGSGSGCASDDVPPEGIVTVEALAERDPFVALHLGVARLIALPAFEADAESLARTLAAILARDEFDPYPLPRGRIRPLLFHIAHPPEAAARAKAIERITTLLQALPPRLPQLPGG